MKAGRELDRAVAIKLSYKQHPDWLCSHGEYCLDHGTFPHYSQDMNQVWDAVDELEKLYHIDIYKVQDKMWKCNLSKQLNCEDIVTGEAPTASHAICLAILQLRL